MSRIVPSSTTLYIPLLVYVAIILNTRYVSGLSERCLELVNLDVDEIENYLTKMDLTDMPTMKMMVAGFKCPISCLPFGTLKSDWSRLLLLQAAQPDGSIIQQKLNRLIRILIIAYYQMKEDIDAITDDASTRKECSTKETTILTENDTNELYTSTASYSSTIRALNNSYHSHMHSTQATPIASTDDELSTKSNRTETEFVTIKNLFNFTGGTSKVPFNVKHQDIVSSTDIRATTTSIVPYYFAVKVATQNPANKIFGYCLEQTINDIARRYPNHTSNNVFERLKNKIKYINGTIQERNEINGKNHTVPKISLAADKFWRYVVIPTEVPLTISTIARPYRTQGLNGFRTKSRKSQKRANMNNDIYQSFRRFYNIDKNRRNIKKYASNRSDIAIEHAKRWEDD